MKNAAVPIVSPPRRGVARRVATAVGDRACRILLWTLGHAVAVGSRVHPAIRSQITRTLTLEITAGPQVARHWVFDGPRRRAITRPGPAPAAQHRLIFTSGGQAVRMLTSPRAVDRIIDAYQHGSVTIEGSALIVLWFYGLTRTIAKIGATPGAHLPLPGAYIRHDPATTGGEQFPIEPAVDELDPDWTAAWNARSRLWIVRAATGEPMPEP